GGCVGGGVAAAVRTGQGERRVIRIIARTALGEYGRPPPVRCPCSANAALILRSDIRLACISRASAATSGRASARVLRPPHLPVSAFLRSRAALSLWTSRAFSYCAKLPAIRRIM